MKINWSKFIGPIGKSKKYKFTRLKSQATPRNIRSFDQRNYEDLVSKSRSIHGGDLSNPFYRNPPVISLAQERGVKLGRRIETRSRIKLFSKVRTAASKSTKNPTTALTLASNKAIRLGRKAELKLTKKLGVSPMREPAEVEMRFVKSSKRFRKPGKYTGPQTRHITRVEGAAFHERQRIKSWFDNPKVKSALSEGRTTKGKVWTQFWKEEKRQKREYAKTMFSKKRK